MTSEAQKRAVKKYKEKYKANIKRLTVDFYPAEHELLYHVSKQPAKQTYIKNLIRKDMEKTGG